MLEYIDEQMPAETPLAFGLHPNAEIGFKLREAETFCNSLVQLQPRESSGEGGMSVEEKAKMVGGAAQPPATSWWLVVPASYAASCPAWTTVCAMSCHVFSLPE